VLTLLAVGAVVVAVTPVKTHVVFAGHLDRAVVVGLAFERTHPAVTVVVVGAAKPLAVLVRLTKCPGKAIGAAFGVETTDLRRVGASGYADASEQAAAKYEDAGEG
jgi:hypothetical protein